MIEKGGQTAYLCSTPHGPLSDADQQLLMEHGFTIMDPEAVRLEVRFYTKGQPATDAAEPTRAVG